MGPGVTQPLCPFYVGPPLWNEQYLAQAIFIMPQCTSNWNGKFALLGCRVKYWEYVVAWGLSGHQNSLDMLWMSNGLKIHALANTHPTNVNVLGVGSQWQKMPMFWREILVPSRIRRTLLAYHRFLNTIRSLRDPQCCFNHVNAIGFNRINLIL